MKVGYLTIKQMAFVYRLICSMRGIRKGDMLSNLNWQAKKTVLNCEHYAEEYFNFDFKSEKYRKDTEQLAKEQLSKLYNKLNEVEVKTGLIDSKTRQIKNSIEAVKVGTINALQNELARLIKSSNYDPCMKFLEGIKIYQWKKAMQLEISEKHKELKHLHKSIMNLWKASKKENNLLSLIYKKKNIIFILIVIALVILSSVIIIGIRGKF